MLTAPDLVSASKAKKRNISSIANGSIANGITAV